MNAPSLLEPQRLPSDATPAVSVLIRTLGRASLAAAIASVRQQTFADWELVVLNAGGGPIAGLPQLLDGVRARVLTPGGRVERAAAANLLLDAASGELALFLDDDDWLLPDHLAKLTGLLRAQPELVAAYGDVEAVAGAGTPRQHTVHVFESDFDPVALQLQNYLPIHAVLFRVDAVRSAPPVRFDTALSLFEDWDFWLQLAAKGPFRRAAGVSAVYAYEVSDGSSHAASGPQRESMLAALAARQLARWRPADVAALIERDGRRTDLLNDSVQRASARERQLQETQAGLEASQRWCAELRHAVDQHLDNLAQQRASLQEQQQTIARQQDAIGQQQQLIAQQQQALAEGSRTVAAQQLALAEQADALARQRQELQVLAHVREELLAQIADIRQSTSWRITRPLRGAGRAAGLLKARARSMANLGSAVGSQVRKHGAIGFARRLPYYLRHREAYLSRVTGIPAGHMTNPFDAPAPVPRDVPLHPDLEGAGEPFDVKVSVVIPTLNAGTEFGWLLRKLRAQRGLRELQIVIVDSGSRDGTVAMAREAGAKVVEIAPSEFTHSHSRNLGADAADGDYLLFMVQDAFPIGEYWLHGMLRFLRDPQHERLAAVSCSESSRSDSDLMYDAMIDTHYRFLGCLEQDRVGRHRGDDHMSLRSQGQLSDVSCLIGRELFGRYRYRGDYAEDLDLGIRLIQDGWQVAMLASVKVVHSHNRPAYYYLKRSFVDVQFLVELFDDFTYPRSRSLPGLAAGIASAAAHVSGWLADIERGDSGLTGGRLKAWIARWRQDLEQLRAGEPAALGDQRLEAFVAQLALRHPVPRQTDAVGAEIRQFNEMLMGRLEHFGQYAAQVYDDADELPRHEFAAAVCKTLAATAGSALGFYCLDHRQPGAADRADADSLHRELTAGV
ncbi:glycosyltransferase [Ramlibacter sp.]|uniref:glycosyltransferase family 2 protein n=1 Tax=Ramlibacter sp. TaxID=1917967 RepID=UPI002B820683|nr:glycosyltransferase [Ramlibacter sp.]HWI84517.1 glycosyltransferase [Ramlibacter sp.]